MNQRIFIAYFVIMMGACGEPNHSLIDASHLHVVGKASAPLPPFPNQASSTVLLVGTNRLCSGVYIQKGTILTSHHCVENSQNSDISERGLQSVVFSLPSFLHFTQNMVFAVKDTQQIENLDLALVTFEESMFFASMQKMLRYLFPQPVAIADSYPAQPLEVMVEGVGGAHKYYNTRVHTRKAPLTVYPRDHLDKFVKTPEFMDIWDGPRWMSALDELLHNELLPFLMLLQNLFSQYENIHHEESLAFTTPSKSVAQKDNPNEPRKSSNLCSGDSGAPLYVQVDDVVQVIGIVTAVYTNMKPHLWNGDRQESSKQSPNKQPQKMVCSAVGLAYILPSLQPIIRSHLKRSHLKALETTENP